MAAWGLTHLPWPPLVRRFRLDTALLSAVRGRWSHVSALSEETPSMQEMKREPYPSTPADTDVFEEMDEMYVARRSRTMTATSPTFHSKDSRTMLANLVEEGRYDDAGRVYEELKSMGATIAPDAVYTKAALHAFYAHRNAEERLTAFLNWWSLIPDRSKTGKKDRDAVQRVLFHEVLHDIPVFYSAAILAAAKGYGHSIARRALLHIFRYKSPSFSSSFLELFNQATLQSTKLAGANIEKHVQWSCMLHSIAVRAHTISGRFDEAIEVIKKAHSIGIDITPPSYVVLGAALRREFKFAKWSILEDLYQTQITTSRAYYAKIPRDLDSLIAAYPKATQVLPATVSVTMSDLVDPATAIRVMRQALISSDIASSTVLAELMETYVQEGHLNALSILRQEAYAAGPVGVGMWSLGEMLYYYNNNQWDTLQIVYAKHFPLTNLPKEVYRLIQSEYPTDRVEGPPASQLPFLVSSEYPIEEKLRPLRLHNALVWRTCTRKASVNVPQLESLYCELLCQIAAAHGMPLNEHDIVDRVQPNYTDTVPAPLDFDDAHFNPFITAFGQQCGLTRAEQVFADMHRFGIRPSVHSYNALCTVLATHGETDALLHLLDCMEGDALATATPTAVEHSSDTTASAAVDRILRTHGDGENGHTPLPCPDLVTYSGVLRNLKVKGNWRDAAIIVARFKANYDYASGSHEAMDEVLSELAPHIPRTQHVEDATIPVLSRA